MFTGVFPKLANLLAFVTLGAAILLIVRGSLAAQVRVFRFQSFVLALLAGIVAAFAGSAHLFGVALALAVVKGVVIRGCSTAPWRTSA